MVTTQLALNVRTKIGQAIARQEGEGAIRFEIGSGRIHELGWRQRGQGLVEYALIIVLVAIAVIIAVMALGTQLQTVFKTIVNNLSTAS